MEVLDLTYVPETPEHKELFNEKQKYMYAILEQKVITDRGKGFVRDHENDYDAQKVYQKLVDHHLKSTKAMIDSSSILSYITSVRLGSGMWKGTTKGFIIHWENQIRLYERQVPSTDHFSDGQKRTMLENAVAPINELRQIKGNADLEKVRTGRALTFAEYSSLLLSASAAYDEAFKPKTTQRLAYAHDFGNSNNVFDTDDPDVYGIDVSVHELQAYAHNRVARPKPTDKPNVLACHLTVGPSSVPKSERYGISSTKLQKPRYLAQLPHAQAQRHRVLINAIQTCMKSAPTITYRPMFTRLRKIVLVRTWNSFTKRTRSKIRTMTATQRF
jgi:hypothetical protein